MNVWVKKLRLNWPILFFVLYMLICVALLVLHFWRDLGEKWSVIVSGVAASTMVAILQFIWAWMEGSSKVKLKQLKVIDVLLTRDDSKYYSDKIERARERIDVLGATCSRFLEDFADDKDPRAERKVLLTAMRRGVQVRILIAAADQLSESNRVKHQLVVAKLRQLANDHSFKIEFGTYEHMPTHSIVRIDGICIAGPHFPGKESKHTPAIALETDSQLATSYLEYFEEEWKAKTVPER